MATTRTDQLARVALVTTLLLTALFLHAIAAAQDTTPARDTRADIHLLIRKPGYNDTHRLAMTLALNAASRDLASGDVNILAGLEARYFFSRELALSAGYSEQLPLTLETATEPVDRVAGARLGYTFLRGKAALFARSLIRFDVYATFGADARWEGGTARAAPSIGLGQRFELGGDFLLDAQWRAMFIEPTADRLANISFFTLGLTYRVGGADHEQDN